MPFFLLLYAVYLHFIKKQKIPAWFWLGIGVFVLGLLVVLYPSANVSRLKGYGKAEHWVFMGQSYNWLEMGFEKYIYAFIKHFFISNYTVMALPVCGLFVYFWVRLYKYGKDFKSLESSLFYFILAWFMAGVMIASPVFSGGPPLNCIIILLISLWILYADAVGGIIILGVAG